MFRILNTLVSFKLPLTLVFFFTTHIVWGRAQHVDVQVQAPRAQAMRIFFGVIGDDQVHDVAQRVKHDLEFAGQFDITVKQLSSQPRKQAIEQLANDEYPLALFICQKNQVEWRLYETIAADMVAGKRMKLKDAGVAEVAHRTAESVWKALTGQNVCFASTLAYCKNKWADGTKQGHKHHPVSHVYCCDALDPRSNERPLVTTDSHKMGLSWSPHAEPLLVYSEDTVSNVRLMMANTQGRTKVVSDFDGINMQAAYSPNGQEVVYALTREGKSDLFQFSYNKRKHRGTYRQLTRNRGNNFAPCFADSDTVYFSSDAARNQKPHICKLDVKTGHAKFVTKDGYAVGPSYCPTNGKLAYAKMMSGKLQIMTYDPATEQHTQMTFDDGSKEDCTWSPCGNFLAFSSDEKGTSRIGVLALATGKVRYVTPRDGWCSSPAWAPTYLV